MLIFHLLYRCLNRDSGADLSYQVIGQVEQIFHSVTTIFRDRPAATLCYIYICVLYIYYVNLNFTY